MKLEGIHHVTAITGNAPRNVDFYTRVLGLRLVKKTVNQDDPTVYHLFYADEHGSAGADLTFFEYPDARRGGHGAGMVHTIVLRVTSAEAIDFWADRLAGEDMDAARSGGSLSFEDPEGIGLELRVVETTDEPLSADHPEIPAEVALQGFDGVRAYAIDPEASRRFLEDTLAFEPLAERPGEPRGSPGAPSPGPLARTGGSAAWEIRGERRGSWYAYDMAPHERGFGGAGTVHHVAWASPMDEHEAWRERVARTGAHPTPVIDRFYFRSIYFREPSGVLFEIATIGPGFTTDEPLESLGEKLALPPNFEHLRERLEPVLTPLPPTRPAKDAR